MLPRMIGVNMGNQRNRKNLVENRSKEDGSVISTFVLTQNGLNRTLKPNPSGNQLI